MVPTVLKTLIIIRHLIQTADPVFAHPGMTKFPIA